MKRMTAVILAAAALAVVTGLERPVEAKAPWVKKAQAMGFTEITDCLSCHTKSSGKELGPRGQFLVDRKKELGLEAVDLQWLKDYKEPESTPTPDAPKPQDPQPRKD
jgi:hypothetical protein